ncbi:MAG: hydantoinase/oxoprolinase family protein, partial [Xanthobacteraceae bacterium]
MGREVSQAGVRVAVDIGGTFTDIVLMSPDGVLSESKVSTTPDDPSRAVVDGLLALLRELRIAPGDVVEILHGTTVGSNTILQKSGAKTGLITTRGFRDVLEIGRIRMPEMFDLTWSKPTPLVPRRHRVEIDERIAADGSVVKPLDEPSLERAVEQLVSDGIEAVAICFINSYRNAAHERQAEAFIKSRHPDLPVSASYAVLPEIKEYERTSTTVVNAYLLSAMRDYLDRLEIGLHRIGVSAPIMVMTSNGGMLTARGAAEKPVMVVASGPAGGVIGGVRLGQALDLPNLIVFDMGGTTAKAVIVENGRPSMTSEYEFRDGMSTSSRFIKAGGYMLKVPAIDLAEVGAGGGSLAGVDAGGLLKVGPESAGANPGPACYGLGNARPTVTDANVLLGFINPLALAGGRLAIDRSLSERAIREHVAQPLGISVEDAAHGIRAVANSAMARAIRAVSVERGLDPRDFTVVAMGGNGGIHALDVARQLGIGRVIVPALSGVFSAVGMLSTDLAHSSVRMLSRALADMTVLELRAVMAELAGELTALLRRDGYADGRIALDWEADLRHEGQASELTIAFKDAGDSVAALRDGFLAEYLKTYGYRDESPIELVKIRLTARGLRERRLDFSAIQIEAQAAAKSDKQRAIVFERGEPAVSVP